jgi:hypothetical protein
MTQSMLHENLPIIQVTDPLTLAGLDKLLVFTLTMSD